MSATPPEPTYDLAVVGGGVMGLFTAYFAARRGARVVVLESSVVGDPMTASFGKTRSYRNDYLDTFYARLAHRSRGLWREVEAATGTSLLVECGCLNLASAKVTPDLDDVYAVRADRTLVEVGLPRAEYDRDDLLETYPQFDVDLGRLDVEAGFVDVQAVTRTLATTLAELGVRVVEHATLTGATLTDGVHELQAGTTTIRASTVVVTSGHGTNDALGVLGSALRVPITKDRPTEAFYLVPKDERRAEFLPDALPVFAYLDIGIYGHPIHEGTAPGVKIGFYNPPDVETQDTVVQDVRTFVELCMPSLADAQYVPVTEVDQCFYDLVGDDEFVMGPVPDVADIIVGVGWRGTGYKYAPWVGHTLAHLALTGETADDITRFDPARFAGR